jgi:lipoprotein-anchoring transpeptidase ErfK/SrfK
MTVQPRRYSAELGVVCAGLLLFGCDREAPPGARRNDAPAAPQAGEPTLPPEVSPKKPTARAVPDAGAPKAPHPGPWFVVTSTAAAVYSEPVFERTKKIGYIRNGGKVAVQADRTTTKDCTRGWYQLISGGFVCGNVGTTELTHPEVKFATKQPDLSEVLPYVYARNAKNGTPLYKSVPSREQMNTYEPYLLESEKTNDSVADDGTAKKQIAEGNDTGSAVPRAAAETVQVGQAVTESGVEFTWTHTDAGAASEPEKPWWQREDAKDRLHEVKLEHLSEGADDVLARRMVAGFYVAVDRTFSWNRRSWYKTTKGLIAPADRMWQTTGSKFKGVELDDKLKLPVAWAYGGRKTAPLYTIDEEKKQVRPGESVDVFTSLPLTGRTLEIGGTRYSETVDRGWIKNQHVRVARAATPPADISPDERWVDVNLSDQTLIAYVGTRPVYATLISSGKKSNDKEKDHRTPAGEFRIREKHVTTTMDGDGSAAGDLPYSIEDVPYVMYYSGSYALHGAFWHRNYGVQMSHGCVNLSPLDAKHLFLFTEPALPEGWHGVWSSGARPGSRIVIRD